jgi:hypothetical protein
VCQAVTERPRNRAADGGTFATPPGIVKLANETLNLAGGAIRAE